jgi:hypothetical protein
MPIDYQAAQRKKIIGLHKYTKYIMIMKKFITLTLAVLFTAVISSCKKQTIIRETASLHSYENSARRDLGSAD